MTSRRHAGRMLLLLAALTLRVGVSAPQLITAELTAVSHCTAHSKMPRSVADASQCCQVANAAGDRAVTGTAPALPPAPPVVALLPRPAAIVPAGPVLLVADAGELQRDGPPRYLTLRTLLI